MRMLRFTALAVGCATGARVLGGWAAELAAVGVGRVEDAVALAAAVGAAVLAAWYAVSAAVLVLAELAALGRRTGRVARGLRAVVSRCGAPALRRTALLGLGAGLALGAVPASAEAEPTLATATAVPADWVGIPAQEPSAPAPTAGGTTAEPGGEEAVVVPPDLRPGAVTDLTEHPVDPEAHAPAAEASAPPTAAGSPVPPRAAGSPAPNPPTPSTTPAPPAGTPAGTPAPVPPSAAPAPAPPPGRGGAGPTERGTGEQGAEHVVRPGDCLWDIAAEHLGPGATAADIARAWPRWYTTNRAVIGADPDLIHPGQQLVAPDAKDPS